MHTMHKIFEKCKSDLLQDNPLDGILSVHEMTIVVQTFCGYKVLRGSFHTKSTKKNPDPFGFS